MGLRGNLVNFDVSKGVEPFHNGWLESHKNSNHFGSDHKFNETVQALVVSRYKVCGMNANAAS